LSILKITLDNTKKGVYDSSKLTLSTADRHKSEPLKSGLLGKHRGKSLETRSKKIGLSFLMQLMRNKGRELAGLLGKCRGWLLAESGGFGTRPYRVKDFRACHLVNLSA